MTEISKPKSFKQERIKHWFPSINQAKHRTINQFLTIYKQPNRSLEIFLFSSPSAFPKTQRESNEEHNETSSEQNPRNQEEIAKRERRELPEKFRNRRASERARVTRRGESRGRNIEGAKGSLRS